MSASARSDQVKDASPVGLVRLPLDPLQHLGSETEARGSIQGADARAVRNHKTDLGVEVGGWIRR